MKRSIFLAVMAIVFVAFASCNRHNEEIDPIYGTKPVTNAFYTDADGERNFPIDEYHRLGQKGDTTTQRALVNAYRKQLTLNVVRQYPKISDERNIHFVLGSGFAREVMSGDGKAYSGPFQNELIIILNDKNIKDTVFLACGNGMLKPLYFDSQTNFGEGDAWIEVKENDSYAKFFPDSWGERAKKADVGIRDEKGKMVTSETYNERQGIYFSMLRPGDKINIITGVVVDENWKRVDFRSRQYDTQRANRERSFQGNNKWKRRWFISQRHVTHTHLRMGDICYS